MNTHPTPPTASTDPACSETSTTPTAAGGMCGTDSKRREPGPGFLRERKRKKRALHEVQALKQQLEIYRETEATLSAEVQSLRAQVRAQEQQKAALQAKLDYLCKVEVKPQDRAYEFKITVEMTLSMRELERDARRFLEFAVAALGEHFRQQLMTQELLALVQSPLLLSEAGPAGQVLELEKFKWLRQSLEKIRRAPEWEMRGNSYFLSELWDAALAALRRAGAEIPPCTIIRWVLERPREEQRRYWR